jgi:hypothetical protein
VQGLHEGSDDRIQEEFPDRQRSFTQVVSIGDGCTLAALTATSLLELLTTASDELAYEAHSRRLAPPPLRPMKSMARSRAGKSGQ